MFGFYQAEISQIECTNNSDEVSWKQKQNYKDNKMICGAGMERWEMDLLIFCLRLLVIFMLFVDISTIIQKKIQLIIYL
jgi:hypothetical protein